MEAKVQEAIDWLERGFKTNGFAPYIESERRKLEIAELIKSIYAELEKVTNERDAYYNIMVGLCATCIHAKYCVINPVRASAVCWQWKG